MGPELIADYACYIGEGPLWHPMEKRLYWTDIPRGRMFRFDPVTGRHEQFYEGAEVGGFTIQEDGALLLFMAGGAVAVWREGKLSDVVEEIPEERQARFNDVIADPAGRVFCGTMTAGDGPGRLYRLDTDGSYTNVIDAVNGSNGMGFTPDRKGMYYTETFARKISLFDYEVETGRLSNQRPFSETPADEGVPDGMTVDAEGYVWSARWDGSALMRYTPAGVFRAAGAIPRQKGIKRHLWRRGLHRHVHHYRRGQQQARGRLGRGRPISTQPGHPGGSGVPLTNRPVTGRAAL